MFVNAKLQGEPLGIPTVKDRIVQQATLLILEPIFEQDFLDCSYGFRPGRSAHQALDEIEKNLKQGRTAVYDADLKGYFDSIPHDQRLCPDTNESLSLSKEPASLSSTERRELVQPDIR